VKENKKKSDPGSGTLDPNPGMNDQQNVKQLVLEPHPTAPEYLIKIHSLLAEQFTPYLQMAKNSGNDPGLMKNSDHKSPPKLSHSKNFLNSIHNLWRYFV